jgi:hypothetical protein
VWVTTWKKRNMTKEKKNDAGSDELIEALLEK